MSQILNKIRQLLPAIVRQSTWDQAADEDRFEGYLFALVLKAARKEGAHIGFENCDGPFRGIATFRTSPGHIYSRIRPYTHAVIYFPHTPPLEAHVGLYVTGRSRLRHEADVVVLGRDFAHWCRQGKTDPPQSACQLLLECKYYASDPGMSIGREFLGLSAEFSVRKCVFVTNQQATRLQELFRMHCREWRHQILPGKTYHVGRMVSLARRAFALYRARWWWDSSCW